MTWHYHCSSKILTWPYNRSKKVLTWTYHRNRSDEILPWHYNRSYKILTRRLLPTPCRIRSAFRLPWPSSEATAKGRHQSRGHRPCPGCMDVRHYLQKFRLLHLDLPVFPCWVPVALLGLPGPDDGSACVLDGRRRGGGGRQAVLGGALGPFHCVTSSLACSSRRLAATWSFTFF